MNPAIRNILLSISLMLFSVFTFAQGVSKSTTPPSVTKPLSKKDLKKFSIGVNAGVLNPAVAIGGSNDFTNPQTTFGYGGNLKYQLAHYFAVQADVVLGTLKGNQDAPLYKNGPPSQRYISSFKTDLKFAASLGGVITFPSLTVKNKIVPYLSAGAGIAHYDVKIVNKGSTTVVDYSKPGTPIKEFFVPVGAGFKFRLSTMINIDLGYRMNFVDGDNLDGTKLSTGSYHKDKFQYGFAGIEFSFGKKSNEQLMFYDPIDHLTDQITKLQTQIDTLFSRVSVVDSDGDGVIDQLDREPNTPVGCPVDTHGVTKDTDGDGVPDCKDKQLITPTECQPVDADGVGKCPDPPCCKEMMNNTPPPPTCNIGDLPSISFKGNTSGLVSDAKALLATVASKLKESATCNITVTGYPAASKASQALSNKRVNAIKAYLIEKEGISADRITTNNEVGSGDANTVDIKSISK